LFAGKSFDLRLSYDGEFGNTLKSNGGSISAAYRF
jgi:hypothetical protein